MSYAVSITGSGRRYIRRLKARISERLIARLEELANDPYDARISKPLHGRLAVLRSTCIAPLRILYERVDGDIPGLDVGPREDICKR